MNFAIVTSLVVFMDWDSAPIFICHISQKYLAKSPLIPRPSPDTNFPQTNCQTDIKSSRRRIDGIPFIHR